MENSDLEYTGPKHKNLFKPLIDALKELGGSGNNDEIVERIITNLNLNDEVINFRHSDYHTELEYQLGWTKTTLKNLGFVSNTKRKVWVLTQKGQECNLSNQELVNIYRKYQKEYNIEYRKKKQEEQEKEQEDIEDIEDIEEIEEIEEKTILTWKQELKKILLEMNPFDFEKFVGIMLRESGFKEIEITKKTGDGGFDGKGILELNNLVSVPIIFECKRYKDVVSAEKIRSFGGTMRGRVNKGLFITTGSFTRPAREEAKREGTDIIDLVDGDDLIEILKKLQLGVKEVKTYVVNREWFDNNL